MYSWEKTLGRMMYDWIGIFPHASNSKSNLQSISASGLWVSEASHQKIKTELGFGNGP
ncbi:hypothetical protein BRADI_1g46843v3 [Brachypodium distachyon]|uniref:Uncharacterized protein n=1 Tax=Brachypodium distachyon TaxID=15368 RepID=A0A2K2DPU3_BRADI|nr:hypothetical protein BRADI_1g46843v3 [Brachypodium distachyon]